MKDDDPIMTTTQNNGTLNIHADVDAAIDRSIETGEPSRLPYSQCAASILFSRCESWTYNEHGYQYYGGVLAGNRWRVHLHR